jgi:antitoxin ParD1/3/4
MPIRLTTMNVSLPATMRKFIQQRMRQEGYANASEYMRFLVREEQTRLESRLRGLVKEGMESGEPIEMTPRRWAEFRASLVERPARKKSA